MIQDPVNSAYGARSVISDNSLSGIDIHMIVTKAQEISQRGKQPGRGTVKYKKNTLNLS